MTMSISNDTQLALNFYEAVLKEKNPDKMRALTSQNFHSSVVWNYGKAVKWDNVEQMIGALELALWNATCKDFNVDVVEEDVLKSVHEEKPKALNSTFMKVTNVWNFTFTSEGGERKIDSVRFETEVTQNDSV